MYIKFYLSVLLCVCVPVNCRLCVGRIRLFLRLTFVTAIASSAFHGVQEMYAKLLLLCG